MASSAGLRLELDDGVSIRELLLVLLFLPFPETFSSNGRF
jgi:hypothetical protein